MTTVKPHVVGVGCSHLTHEDAKAQRAEVVSQDQPAGKWGSSPDPLPPPKAVSPPRPPAMSECHEQETDWPRSRWLSQLPGQGLSLVGAEVASEHTA